MLLTLLPVVEGAPAFEGVREGLPAYRAAVLSWDRARAARGNVTYRVYRADSKGRPAGRPIGSTTGTSFVIPDLRETEVAFLVHASDASGEDSNTRVTRVRPLSTPPSTETRAAWISRFDWTGGTVEEMQGRIRRHFDNLRRAHFNAVFFQVRAGCDTLYPSPNEPWSPMVPPKARNWDPVAFAIEQAHRNQIEFHAWINTSTAWQDEKHRPPPRTTPEHPFFKHLDAARGGDWLIANRNGKPLQWGADNYVWLSPGNPEAEAFVRAQVMYLVRHYDIDGIHFDDRTGAPNGESRDAVSDRRFHGIGNPAGERDFLRWQLDQITLWVANIGAEARSLKPTLKVTAAPFGIYDRERIPGYRGFSDCITKFGTDPEAWMKAGAVDTLAPQIYWDFPNPEPNFDTVADDWLRNNRTGRPMLFGALKTKTPVSEILAAITYGRAHGAAGFSLFDLRAMSDADWRRLATTVYDKGVRPASIPRPRGGTLIGRVHDPAGRPIVDARVTLGPGRLTTSSADGFFALLQVPAGKVRVEVRTSTGAHVFNTEVADQQTCRLDALVDTKP